MPIKGAQVISSNTEEDMLLTWRTFLHASDADIFTGYNVQVRIFVSAYCLIMQGSQSHQSPVAEF